eukprot:198136-Heterocapsa_arctica.AAC.1
MSWTSGKENYVIHTPRGVATSTPASASTSSLEIQIFVEMLAGNTITLNDVVSFYNIRDVKAMISDKEGIPMDQQHLLFNSRMLEDHRILSFYGIGKESTLRLNSTLSGGGKRAKVEALPVDNPFAEE